MLAQCYVDVASLSDLVTTTGGTLYTYMPYSPANDYDQLANDLRWSAARLQGLEAVMRVRVSQGLDVESYSGFCYRWALVHSLRAARGHLQTAAWAMALLVAGGGI